VVSDAHSNEEVMMPTFRPVAALLMMVALFSLSAAPARADVSGGFRVGFSADPDQVLVGGQLNLDPVSSHVYIVPSGEAGFGDDAFTLSFNGDVQYRFDVQEKVRPYAGGGLTVYYVNFDNDFGGGDDTNVGVTILGGIFFGRDSGHPMFAEAKAGLTDEVPDWKFIFGINF
jgi:hypothetical protein